MKSIAHILVVALLIVGLIPLALMTAQGYHCARAALLEEAQMHLRTVVLSRLTTLQHWLSERVADIAAIASDPYLAQSLGGRVSGEQYVWPEPAVSHFIEVTKQEGASFARLCLLELDGAEVACSAGNEHRPEGLVDADILAKLKSSSGAVMGRTHLHPDGLTGMHVACYVRAPDGQPVAIVAGLLPVAPQVDRIMLDPVGLEKTGQAFLIDEEGRLASRTLREPPEAIAQMQIETAAVQRALAGESGVAVYRNPRGRSVVGAFTPVAEIGGALIAEMELSEALRGLAIYRHNATWIGAATLVLLVLLAVAISRHLSKPLVELRNATERVAQGGLDARIDMPRQDEIGDLAEAFNRMTESLKEAQDKLVRRETLAAIGELTSSVVHELRNPLSSVKMNLQLLQRQLREEPNAEHVRLALDQALKLERRLSDLLQYGRPMQLQLKRVPAAELFKEAVTLASACVAAEQCEIRRRGEELPHTIQADVPKLASALANLLCNAAQAAPRDRAVHFSLDVATLRGKPAVAFTVKDSGRGISKSQMSELFHPFFTTREDGTGLGLANSKKVVEAHHGTLEVQSVEGEGSTFRVSLPVESESA